MNNFRLPHSVETFCNSLSQSVSISTDSYIIITIILNSINIKWNRGTGHVGMMLVRHRASGARRRDAAAA